jgi:hypothetical protein
MSIAIHNVAPPSGAPHAGFACGILGFLSFPIRGVHPVLSSPLNAVKLFTARPLRLLLAFFFSCTILSATPTDTTIDDALHQFAERIAAIPNLHGPVHLQFLQSLAFQAETGQDWQETFRKEIENRRIHVTDDASANLLRIGLAETPTQVIFSAAIQVAGKEEVRFFAIPRASFRAANLPVAPVRIERQLVYQSADRILDASSLWNGAEGGMAILVSHNSDLSVLRIDASGQTAQTIPLAGAANPSTRDPRGEIAIHANEITVLLPTRACDFSWSSSVEAKCHAAQTLWRNPTVLTPSCDPNGWKLLADGPDWSTPESLQVVPAGSLRQGSASLLSEFPGPVLSINGEQNPASSLVVSKNLRTGNYEVYKITLVCGN